MSNEPYLILHKVRGEAAFDIAIKLEDIDEDGEPFWIIPTSGHRAHPYAHCSLYSISLDQFLSLHREMPSGWPDHYPSRSAPSINIQSVISALAKPTEPVERRF